MLIFQGKYPKKCLKTIICKKTVVVAIEVPFFVVQISDGGMNSENETRTKASRLKTNEGIPTKKETKNIVGGY